MIDLHLHLDGSLDPGDMVRMAELAGIALPTADIGELGKLLVVEPDCTNLGEYLEKFDLPLRVLQTEGALKLAVDGLLKRLAAQGLCYAEIRFAPQLHTAGGLTQGEVVRAVAAGLKEGMRDGGILANLILCCMRGDDNGADNRETVRVAGEFLGRGVCAVDLAGNEAAYPTGDYADIFRDARRDGIPVILHAGEAAGADSIRKALDFGAVRIGHGIRAVEDSALLEELKDRRVVLELCYSSNLQTRAADCLEHYPLVRLMDGGIPVTVNTDNMTVSNTTLRNEYHLIQRQFGLDEEELKAIALNAAGGAFVTEQERVVLKDRIDRDFSGWLASAAGTDSVTARHTGNIL